MSKELMRESFQKWFKESSKPAIDPWYKEFVWAIWQAAWQVCKDDIGSKSNDQ